MDSNRSLEEDVNEYFLNEIPVQQSRNPENLRNRRRGAINTVPVDAINLLRLGNSFFNEGATEDYTFSLEEIRPLTRRNQYLRRRRSKIILINRKKNLHI